MDTTTDSSAAPTTTVESAPPTTAAVAGYEATIRRTTDGVPHITGAPMGDVTFGQGYANGEDHACTVADQILKVKGQRARWFGPGEGDANINSDLAWRAIGIDRRARNDYETASPEVVEAFDGFAAGWSAHLEEVGPGGVSGWCAGKKWLRPISGEDVYAYARSIALLASSGALTDFIATAAPPTAAARDEETPPSTNGFARARLDRRRCTLHRFQRVGRRSREGHGRRGRTARRQPALPVGGRAQVLGSSSHRAR
ncbi:MAG: penicillin acylase family protein [Ilumatobacteraceae bacterium]